MSEWHPNRVSGLGLHGCSGEYYKIAPIEHPGDPSDVYLLTIEVDDEDGTIIELGNFDNIGDAKLHAERDYAEKFVNPGPFDSGKFMDQCEE